MKDVAVGQPIIVVNRGDRHRKGSVDGPMENYHVTKVGREYFYAKPDSGYSMELRFRRDSGKGAGDFNSRQAFRDEHHYQKTIAMEKKFAEASSLRHAMRVDFLLLEEWEIDQLIHLLKKAGAK